MPTSLTTRLLLPSILIIIAAIAGPSVYSLATFPPCDACSATDAGNPTNGLPLTITVQNKTTKKNGQCPSDGCDREKCQFKIRVRVTNNSSSDIDFVTDFGGALHNPITVPAGSWREYPDPSQPNHVKELDCRTSSEGGGVSTPLIVTVGAQSWSLNYTCGTCTSGLG